MKPQLPFLGIPCPFLQLVRGLACCLLLLIVWSASIPSSHGQQPVPTIDEDHAQKMRQGLELFRTKIGNLLEVHCLDCHGQDSAEGELDLTTRAGLLRGGLSGPAIVPGDASRSRLLHLLHGKARPRMPKDAEPLSQLDVDAVQTWISLGAPYQQELRSGATAGSALEVTPQDRQFWSFRPLRRPRIPEIEEQDWCRSPVDYFVLKKLEENALFPVPPSDPRRLVRRVFLDVTGLPPTSEDLDRFASTEEWPHLVDRLLDDSAYGERWARHWLDLVRFAESYGFEHDLDNEHAFHYRDFVIWALNQDLPFDRFVRWQIAGDELAPNVSAARIATGFLAAGVHNADIAKVRVAQERSDELDDIAATIGTSLLGLSVGCARCHDHKFDPISQQNYYEFVANFERTVRGELELKSLADGRPAKVLVAGEGVPPLARLYNPGPAFFTTSWFLRRGDARLKAHEVFPHFLEVLTPLRTRPDEWRQPPPADGLESTYRRSALARWITDTERGAGSLVARVIANRVWQHHFGQGIVSTPNDFGRRGARPTNPALLEFLACELVEKDWSLKHLHRLVLRSATYRQGAREHDERRARDVNLFRGHTQRRLDAETIRDQMLALSGTLDRTMYGPGSLDAQQRRRSIYFRIKRSRLIPSLVLFDAPDALQGIGERPTSTVAPQALHLMNATPVRGFARGFADRLEKLSQGALEDAVELAFYEALARKPSELERADAIQFIEAQRGEYQPDRRPRVTSPVDGSVLWLDSKRLSGTDVEEWRSRTEDDTGLSPQSDALPELTPAGVLFGPAPSFLGAGDDGSLSFGTEDFTITVLFRPESLAGGLLGKDSYPGSGNSYTGYFLQLMDGRLRFSTRNLREGEGPVNYLDSDQVLQAGQWCRATAVRRGGVLELFLDAVEEVHRAQPESAPTNVDFETDFKLGEFDDDRSGGFHGTIGEVLMYDRALSLEEVRLNHEYLLQKHLGEEPATPLQQALTDFCQALFCLNEFVYVD